MPEAITESKLMERLNHSNAIKRGLVSESTLNRAARELNMITLSSRKLANVATMGQFVNELGLIRYGNGRLLGSAQMIAQGAQACAEMSLKDGLTEEQRQGYMDLQLRFIKALDENVAMQLEINKTAETNGASQSMPQGKSFLPGAQVSPIQILITGGTVSEKKVEESCKTS